MVKDKNKLLLFSAIFGVFAFLLYFNYCVPITSDDMMFLYDSFSFENILYFGNGRFIGNMLADIVQIPILAIIERSTITLSIILLICKLLNRLDITSFCITSVCVLLPSSNIFSETYSWNAGYQNYVVPIVFVLISTNLIKSLYKKELSRGKKLLYIITLVITGFIGQFFSENTSVFTVIIGGILFLLMLIKNKRFDIISFLYTLSTSAGFVIMMITPYILNVSDKMNGYRGVQTSIVSLIKTALSNYYSFSLSFLGNYIVFTVISVALIVLISNKKLNYKSTRLFKTLLILLPVLSMLLDNFVYQTTKPSVYIKILIILVIPIVYVLSILFVTTKIGWRNLTENEKFSIFAFAAGIISFIPLLLVSPVGGRTFYLTYICITIGAVCLLLENTKNIKNYTACSTCILIAYILSFSFAFTDVKYSFDLREDYLQEQIKNEISEIPIPMLPNQRYIHSDTSSSHWDFYFERNTDYDVNYSFTDWESWVVENNIPH